jgi:hypothetical protein
MDVYKNAFMFTANSVEPIILLSLGKKVNGDVTKSYFGGITAAFLSIFLLVFLCMSVMGEGGSLQAYPIFTLFQMASISTFSRLDMVHTAFWVFAVFVKGSVLIYCASSSVKSFSHRNKSIVVAVLVAGVAILINEVIGMEIAQLSKPLAIGMFSIFCVLIPILFLVFKKKSKGDKVLEKF